MQLLDYWQNLPSIVPSGFQVFGFPVHFYGLMYLLAFLICYLLLRYRLSRKEADFSLNLLEDFVFTMILGVILGGRLGYVLFYNLGFFLENPLQIVWPFLNGQYIGISGMSFHGGLIACVILGLLFVRKRGVDALKFADFIVPAVPLGYMFGRLGNFLNQELFGRPTDFVLAMNFEGALRHPSQLYEAFFEGLVLFAILWFWRKSRFLKNRILLAFLVLYSGFRFAIEFVREPDPQIGLILGLSLGQYLCLATMLLALVLQKCLKNSSSD